MIAHKARSLFFIGFFIIVFIYSATLIFIKANLLVTASVFLISLIPSLLFSFKVSKLTDEEFSRLSYAIDDIMNGRFEKFSYNNTGVYRKLAELNTFVTQIHENENKKEKVDNFADSKFSEVKNMIEKASNNLTSNINEMDAAFDVIDTKNKKLLKVSEIVYKKAENISDNMNNISASIEETQTAFNTIAASTEEMNATIGEISQNTQKAKTITEKVKTKMDDIHVKMNLLQESSMEIQSVVDIITEIASQTNLLALNATIEAARAGEAGKGFAVVANEIKTLAMETNNATSDIKNKISNIISSTHEATNNISEVKVTTDNMNELIIMIASAIEEQSATTNEISSAIVQSTAAIEEVTKNIISSAQDSQEATQNAMDISKDIGEIQGLLNEMTLSFDNLIHADKVLGKVLKKL